MFATIRPGLPGRLEVVFPTAPPAEVRGALKARGFRWHARDALWFGPIDALPVEILTESGITLHRDGEPEPEPVTPDGAPEASQASQAARPGAPDADAGPRILLDCEAPRRALEAPAPERAPFRSAWAERARRERVTETARALLEAAAAQCAAHPDPAPEPAPQPVAVSTLAPAADPPRYARAPSRPTRGPAPRKGGGFFDALGV